MFIDGPDTNINYFPWYSLMGNAPNGKMYIGNFNGTRNTMSYIDKPNIRGLGCDFVSQGVSQPYNNNLLSPPNMPNYGLVSVDTVHGCFPLSNQHIAVSNEKLVVYPNPASSKIVVKASPTLQWREKELYNSIGQLILSTKENEIYVGNLAKGIYYLKVGNLSKRVVVE